jgi:bifunctional NMN adenylyltransferase/nudix hydrolase
MQTIGVVVARFQVPELHAGHIALISHALSRHERVLVVLGVHGDYRTERDPLTFEERRYMVRQAFPDSRLLIASIPDHPLTYELWSEQLDVIIGGIFPDCQAVLYGSRDSFLPKYTGKYATVFVPALPGPSGTELRAGVSFPRTKAGRAGAIYAVVNRDPIAYARVALAVVDSAHEQVLLYGAPETAGLLAFFGGPMVADDVQASTAASRHLCEAVAQPMISEPRLLGVLVTQEEPEIRWTNDCAVTSLLVAEWQGTDRYPAPTQGHHRLRWINRSALDRVLVPWHLPLRQLLNAHW